MASRNQEGDYRYASRVQTNMEQCLLRRSCSCCMWCVGGGEGEGEGATSNVTGRSYQVLQCICSQ